MAKSKFLSSAMVAEKLEGTPAYVRLLCASGKIKALKLGHDWLIDEKDIKKFMFQLEQKHQ